MSIFEPFGDIPSRAGKGDRRILDAAARIGRKTALALCGVLAAAIVIAPLLALLAPEFGR